MVTIQFSWRVIDPFIKGWQEQGFPLLALYERGNWRLAEADELLTRDARQWRLGCVD